MRQTPRDKAAWSHSREGPRRVRLSEKEGGGCWGRGGECVFDGDSVPAGKMKSPGDGGGDDHTSTRMHLMSLSCALKNDYDGKL